jgi:SPP1 gp7 family putative phage head morphogenesis protein
MEKIYRNVIKRLYRKSYPKLFAAYKQHIGADESFRESLAELLEDLSTDLTQKYLQNQIERVTRAVMNWTEGKVMAWADKLKDSEKKDYILLAIEHSPEDPEIIDFTELYIQKNIDLVEALGKEYIDGVGEAAESTFLSGGSMEELSETMLDFTEGNIAKAEFWARDQMGDAYAAYTETMNKRAGIENFIWRTVGDNHVRETHAELEDRIFTWEKGVLGLKLLSKPGAKFPGEDYNCRCSAESTFDEAEEVGGEDDEGVAE